MIRALQKIAEQRIAKAIEDGTLKTEGWKNRPLPLDDDAFVPDDLKMAYKILKNSGYVPPEIETRKEIQKLEDLIVKTEDSHQRVKQMKKLDLLMRKIDAQRSRPSSLEHDDAYFRKIVEKIDQSKERSSSGK
ncbi:MAG: DUF1992 domain-containing protein [Desulfofustis sp.]|nr:DUF1992 domain-containing protein [Desulfofustis sp.]MBT8346183.1 DUF1992 domain-containing protein [Desulfofustis sp.]NNF46033.1 DUF1992 domain-containing protein [Desulfofustis sp.]NNK13791.1 DUF1992 domain-containing protein [Desulfofustis sp.]NNK57670.1 DUF1992 domain-containing protein [Desulfofustis sp.]